MQHCEVVDAPEELNLKRLWDNGKNLEVFFGDFEDDIRILVWGFFVNWLNVGGFCGGGNWEVNKWVVSEEEMEMASMSGIK